MQEISQIIAYKVHQMFECHSKSRAMYSNNIISLSANCTWFHHLYAKENADIISCSVDDGAEVCEFREIIWFCPIISDLCVWWATVDEDKDVSAMLSEVHFHQDGVLIGFNFKVML